MSLWRVLVETTDTSGDHDRFTAFVLANTDLGARRMAGKAVFEVKGCEYRFVEVVAIDPYKTGVLSVIHAEDELRADVPTVHTRG